MAYLSIHGLRIFVFFIISLFMIVLYVYCSSTHDLPIISYSVIWKVLSCDVRTNNYLCMVDLILIFIIVFSTLNFTYLFLSVC
jgi:hypothetical protein